MKRIDIRQLDPTDDVELVMTRRQARLLKTLVGNVTGGQMGPIGLNESDLARSAAAEDIYWLVHRLWGLFDDAHI